MSSGRVVMTGAGWVTPLGCDIDAVWAALLRGECGIGPLTRFQGGSFVTNFAAEVKDFELSDHYAHAKRHPNAGIATRFALAAAAQAVAQAGIYSQHGAERIAQLDDSRFGLYLGAGEGQIDTDNFLATNLAGWNPDRRSVDMRAWVEAAERLLTVEREIEQEPHAVLSHIASAFGCRGPALNCMTACAASTQSVGEAFEMIRRGDADVMLAGGSHSMIHPLGMTGFIRLTAMSKRRDSPQTASRPFDRTREGFVMGEGAGMVVLESLEHALARGAEPIAEVAGFGSTADAYRITDIQPDGAGAAATMGEALRQAGIDPLKPDEHGRAPVQYISAHGTGTKENDAIETKGVKALFGPMAPSVPFSSVKSMFGHLIQAAGAVELITCVQAIKTGFIPPTINLNEPDPACDLDHVPNQARDMRGSGGVEVCLSNGFGFGGQNNTICVRKYR